MRVSSLCHLAFSFLLPVLLAGCRTTPVAREGTCTRRPFPVFPVGANVIDVPGGAEDPEGAPLGLGSAASLRTLDALRSMGLDAIAIPLPLHLDGLMGDDVRAGHLLSPAGRARVESFLDAAHGRGFATLLIPHLVLADGAWRGELSPADPDRFFASYQRALLEIAALGEDHCATALSLGVELRSLTRDPRLDTHFKTLVASTRERFGGLLTYGANWDETESMRHWELIDIIGVNAFYPLAGHREATDSELLEGALQVQRSLDTLSRRYGRPVWFTELGFKATPGSFVRPWEWPEEVDAAHLPVDEVTQARAFHGVFRAFAESEGIDGVFLWMVPSALEEERGEERYEMAQGFGFVGKAAAREVEDLVLHRPHRAPLGRYAGQR